MNVDGLIAHHGYYALFALVALESLGVPLPGETILIAAGTYAGHPNTANLSRAGCATGLLIAAALSSIAALAVASDGS